MKYILAVLAFLLFAFAHRSANFGQGSYRSFGALTWEPETGCTAGAPSKSLPFWRTAATVRSQPERQEAVCCTSHVFALDSATLEVEYAGALKPEEKKRVWLELRSPSGEVFYLSDLTAFLPAGKEWKTQVLKVPNRAAGSSAELVLRADASLSKNSWFSLRSRLNFYSPQYEAFARASLLFKQQRVLSVALILLAVCLIGSQSLSDLASLNSRRWMLMLCAVSLLVHFRFSAFFYFDEWHVLERYMKLGPNGVIYTHNEHFLPLFFAFYYLESLLFGEHYQLYLALSCGIHAFNGLLLGILLRRLAGDSSASRKASAIISVLYVVSSLHSEATHWAFEQSLLLSQSAMFAALIGAHNFVVRGARKHAFASWIAAFSAPLLFGNGFSVAFVSTLVVLGISIFAVKDGGQSKLGASELLSSLKRALVFFAGLGLLSALSGLLYWLFRKGAGHGIENADPLGSLHALVEYILVGSQFGTILRGLGLCHSLDLNAAEQLFPGGLAGTAGAETFAAILGFAASLAILFPIVFSNNRVEYLRFWLVGQLVILSVLVLPALGRWPFGVRQALSLRYHSTALAGLAIMVLPFVIFLVRVIEQPGSALRQTLAKLGVKLYLVFYLTLHLSLAFGFDYFTRPGAEHRRYAEQLTDWAARLTHDNGGIGDFLGTGTKLEGLQPLHKPSITPARGPYEIWRVLNWLRIGNN